MQALFFIICLYSQIINTRKDQLHPAVLFTNIIDAVQSTALSKIPTTNRKLEHMYILITVEHNKYNKRTLASCTLTIENK